MTPLLFELKPVFRPWLRLNNPKVYLLPP